MLSTIKDKQSRLDTLVGCCCCWWSYPTKTNKYFLYKKELQHIYQNGPSVTMVIRKSNHDSGYYISAINKPDFCSIIRFSKAARHIIFDDKVVHFDWWRRNLVYNGRSVGVILFKFMVDAAFGLMLSTIKDKQSRLDTLVGCCCQKLYIFVFQILVT
jgi:hypothetical protein